MTQIKTGLMIIFVISVSLLGSQPKLPFEGPQIRGFIPTRYIPEASGLEMGQNNPDVLWSHNDSGDSSRIFALDSLGGLLGIFTLEGVKVKDCEDITLGKRPGFNKASIYLADIGDNRGRRNKKVIYQFDEPFVDSQKKNQRQFISRIDKIIYRYPDGARDAETIMLDEVTGHLYIVTKRENKVHLYRLKYPYVYNQMMTAEFIQTLDFTFATGGDISSTGNEILIKTYTDVFYWKVNPEQSIVQALKGKPLKLTYLPEPQGEGICFGKMGKGYYTVSEMRYKVKPSLIYYPRIGEIQK